MAVETIHLPLGWLQSGGISSFYRPRKMRVLAAALTFVATAAAFTGPAPAGGMRLRSGPAGEARLAKGVDLGWPRKCANPGPFGHLLSLNPADARLLSICAAMSCSAASQNVMGKVAVASALSAALVPSPTTQSKPWLRKGITDFHRRRCSPRTLVARLPCTPTSRRPPSRNVGASNVSFVPPHLIFLPSKASDAFNPPSPRQLGAPMMPADAATVANPYAKAGEVTQAKVAMTAEEKEAKV